MNKAIISGRLTRDPEGNPNSYARFTLAVDRKYKKEGEQDADFISCVSFGKQADFVLKYLKQGTKIIAAGRLSTGSYEKDGIKHYTTDVITEEIDFAESKKAETPPASEGFIDVPADADNDLPFKHRG